MFDGLSLFLSMWMSWSAGAFSEATESAIGQKTQEIFQARAALEERVVAFNKEESLLQKLTSSKAQEFASALEHLALTTSDRESLKQWHESKDFKRISTYSRKRLLQYFERLTFARAEWETFFTSSLSTSLESEIRAEHLLIVESRRQQAIQESQTVGISLQKIKANSHMLEAFCGEMPKGGILHTHPYGTMDRETVEYVLETFNPVIEKAILEKYIHGKNEKIHPQELSFLVERKTYYNIPRAYKDIRSTYPQDAARIADLFFVPRDQAVFKDGVTPFSRFLAAFALPLEILGILNGNTDNQLALEKIIYDHLFLRGLSQHVDYMEITRNLPVLKSSRQFVDRYEELLKWTQSSQKLRPRTLLSFNRTSLDSAEKRFQHVSTMNQLLSMEPSPYVVGINLMGDESLVDALDASQFIYGKLLVENKSRRTGLQATIHAGELGDVRNLRDALVFDVQRIGHGILLEEKPLYLELVRRFGVALELNITSNDILHVSTVDKNPFLMFHRLGIPVSLSTDDEGMFETDPNRECERAVSHSNIEYTELRQMMFASIETSFADDALKSQLKEKLLINFAAFEKRWKNTVP